MNKISLKTFALSFVVLTATSANAQDVISTCGASTSDGVLTADLDCSAAEIGIILTEGGLFDLAGHTLTPGSQSGIFCEGNCTIQGSGGAITNGARNGIQAEGDKRAIATVANVTISNSGLDAIWANNANVIDCQLLDSGRAGVSVWMGDANVTGSTISGSGDLAIGAIRRINVTGSTLSQNSRGVSCDRRVTIVDSTITDTDNEGVLSLKVRARNSTVQNSGLNCMNPLYCFDIGSRGRPILEDATCGTSERIGNRSNNNQPMGESWGVCTLD